jgi:hypothetical protein
MISHTQSTPPERFWSTLENETLLSAISNFNKENPSSPFRIGRSDLNFLC